MDGLQDNQSTRVKVITTTWLKLLPKKLVQQLGCVTLRAHKESKETKVYLLSST
jgi:hypothetical protein